MLSITNIFKSGSVKKRKRTLIKNFKEKNIVKRRKRNTKTKKRHEEIKRRKNFFPALIFTIILWFLFFYIIYSLDPQLKWSLQVMLFVLFSSLVFTFSLMLANTRRGLIIGFAVVGFLVLRYFGIGNVVNAILITAIAISVELYFLRS